MTFQKQDPFRQLQEIIAKLRDKNGGCPWDLKQTHTSLKPYLIEEAYEVIDAIDAQSPEQLKGELGDILLQVMLHSQIASETGEFSVNEVIEHLSDKMIRRHPHVFGNTKVSDAAEVERNWSRIKTTEDASKVKSLVDGIPRSMPALRKAHEIGKKVAVVGFEWRTVDEVIGKVKEELGEFLECVNDPQVSRERTAEEFGDLFFAFSQLARRLDFEAEDLLNQANEKFCRRFREVEKRAGAGLGNVGVEVLDRLWDDVKAEEKAKAKS